MWLTLPSQCSVLCIHVIVTFKSHINEGPRGPLWAAGEQTDKTGRSLDPAVALVPVN